MKVSILLATYNSSRFLREQLDSLFSQTFKEWVLIVRDDGSTDDTAEIIKQYQRQYKQIKILQDADINVGPQESFMRLLKETDSDYYFFCDHDDIWLPNKVSDSLQLIITVENEHPGRPIIVHSDLKVVDENMQILSESFWKFSKINPNKLESKNLIQVFNCVTGCTMVFNKRVKELSIPYPPSIPMHDWWLAIITLQNQGIIKHITKPTILYRQHSKNEVGARNVNTSYFMKRIRNISYTFKGQKEIRNFLKAINGLNFIQYYYYKVLYTIQRNFLK